MKVLDMFSLAGQTAVLTGGAGKYGRQIAQALYEAGARVFIASSNLENLEKAAAEMRAEGGNVAARHLDLEEEASILALRDEVYACASRVDILINNAVSRPMKSYGDNAESFAASMRVNATGTFLISRAFGDAMAHDGGGCIINIASMQGLVAPDPMLYEDLGMDGFIPDYFFHKGGMIQYTRFLASYYGPYGVRCNAISPGGFLAGQSPEFVKRYAARTMLGRMAGSQDLKGAVVFLASAAARYITAENLVVDGGYTAR